MKRKREYRFVTLPGDGIGPEVLREAERCIRHIAELYGFSVSMDEHLIGGAALERTGVPLPDEAQKACLGSDAVLLGSVGGPEWDDTEGNLRPEDGLLALRKLLQTYANLRPVAVPESLAGASPLRTDVVAGTDLMIVRELTGGIYFGEPKGHIIEDGIPAAVNTMRYNRDEIERIAHVAFKLAEKRRKKVTSVDKANVLAVSQLWRQVVTKIQQSDYPHITLDHLYVDNAAMQIVRQPLQFDVVLTGNMFGDILSDLAATLPGSLGLLPSASIGSKIGLFEPVHGSAPDIAGQDKANPIAAILSSALMFDFLGETEAAQAIRSGVDNTLKKGYRTVDLWREGDRLVSTSQMGQQIVHEAAQFVGSMAMD